jgi:ketosteroid isomerase-like protein
MVNGGDMTRVRMLLAVATVCCMVWSPSQTAEAAAFPSNAIHDAFPAEQRAVADTLRALLDAAERKELDRVDSFHLYGPKFSKFDESGLGRLDAEASQAAERRGISAVRGFRATVEGLKVDVFGVTAIATFVMNYSVEADEGEVSRKRRATLVFAKDRDRWKVVHEHFSPLKPTP